MTPIPAHRIFRILVHFGALYFVSEAGIVLLRQCPYVNYFSVVITKPWNPFHSSKYILVQFSNVFYGFSYRFTRGVGPQQALSVVSAVAKPRPRSLEWSVMPEKRLQNAFRHGEGTAGAERSRAQSARQGGL